jgi:GNAT superfamily N-acetyltransferase
VNQTQVGCPQIRTAGEPDAEGLATMLTGLADHSLYFRFQAAIGRPPRPALLLRLLRPTGGAWVATRDDSIVGHAMWAWVANSAEPTAELAVVISEAEQRRGLGVRMLTMAAADAYDAGAKHFLLVVNAANDRVARMVRRRWPTAPVERDGPLLNFIVPADPHGRTMAEGTPAVERSVDAGTRRTGAGRLAAAAK